jgi:signal transduction histidine kinase
LINSVLDLSKIEAGRMPLHMMSFSVPDLINDIVNAIQPTIAQRHNVLTVQLDPLVPTMYADPTKVRQSLFNLLGNAAKFTHNGHIRLQVGLNECGGKPWVTLAVHDTGIGIAPDQLSHLFKEFTQANNVTEQHGGTGLGLVISQRLCALMGGDIAVQSEVGRGSTFTIRLPARPEPTESQ